MAIRSRRAASAAAGKVVSLEQQINLCRQRAARARRLKRLLLDGIIKG